MSLNDRLAAYFRERPNQWIDGRRLAEVGGYAGWRNRLTDLRLIYGMTTIKNRQRRVMTPNGKITVSEYIYIVTDPEQLPLSDQWSVGV